MTATTPATVLTDIDTASEAVIAMPELTVRAMLTTYDCLAGATTFGEAREDLDARALVDEWLPSVIERAEELDLPAVTGADDEPFNAGTFFGEDDYWWVWRPDPLEATADFLAEVPGGDDLLVTPPYIRLGREDTAPLVPVAQRTRLEELLTVAGWVVRRAPGLADLFDVGADDLDAALGLS